MSLCLRVAVLAGGCGVLLKGAVEGCSGALCGGVVLGDGARVETTRIETTRIEARLVHAIVRGWDYFGALGTCIQAVNTTSTTDNYISNVF